MNARLTPQYIAQRPIYENAWLGHEHDWVAANAVLLRQWWEAGEHFEPDYERFCWAQHDLEVTRRDEFKNTLRMYE